MIIDTVHDVSGGLCQSRDGPSGFHGPFAQHRSRTPQLRDRRRRSSPPHDPPASLPHRYQNLTQRLAQQPRQRLHRSWEAAVEESLRQRAQQYCCASYRSRTVSLNIGALAAHAVAPVQGLVGKPAANPNRISSERLSACIFAISRERWNSTVRMLILSSNAITLFGLP